eukprot:3419641-Alexandrium_andersonii.AAC.1
MRLARMLGLPPYRLAEAWPSFTMSRDMAILLTRTLGDESANEIHCIRSRAASQCAFCRLAT